HRRHHREQFARPAQYQIILHTVVLIERIDEGTGRSLPASFGDSFDLFQRAGEHRLDRVIAAVAHPALDAALERFVLDEGAIADSLDAAAHDDMADHLRAHG